VIASMTVDNHAMQQTCKKLGFKLRHAEQGAMVGAVIDL
jgi:RimJ/RimL family protein N-acetyltransferase